MKKSAIIVFLLLLPISISQEAKVLLNHVGYGKTPQDLEFTIHSSGEVPISDLTIFIDGQEYKRYDFKLEPKKGIALSIHLTPGEHLIEVKTTEGAYDSFKTNVSSLEKTTKTPQEPASLKNTFAFKIAIILIAITIIVLWYSLKKQKLKLE